MDRWFACGGSRSGFSENGWLLRNRSWWFRVTGGRQGAIMIGIDVEVGDGGGDEICVPYLIEHVDDLSSGD